MTKQETLITRVKKYLKKHENKINIALFIQFLIINIIQIFGVTGEAHQILSLILLCIGYFINPKGGEDAEL